MERVSCCSQGLIVNSSAETALRKLGCSIEMAGIGLRGQETGCGVDFLVESIRYKSSQLRHVLRHKCWIKRATSTAKETQS